MTDRIESFEEFWPYYLSQHRNPNTRRLHFAGTTGFLASVVTSSVLSPIAFPLAMAGFGALLADGMRREAKGPSIPHVLGMLTLPAFASPIAYSAGVVFAYGCAWIGHFGIEKNRPATFEYPLWSLAGDFRMWGHMVRGRLWWGDPLEELGFTPMADAARATPAFP